MIKTVVMCQLKKTVTPKKKKKKNGGVRCVQFQKVKKNQQKISKTIKQNQDNHQKMHNTNQDKQQQKNNPGDHMKMGLSIEK